MKVYNSELIELNDQQLKDYFDNLINSQVEFINSFFGINIEHKKDKFYIIESQNKDTYKNVIDGTVYNRNFPKEARAFMTKMQVNHTQNSMDVINGVYIRDYNRVTDFVHESFHALSSKTNLIKDENGNFYDKIGLNIKDYDKDENEINKSLFAKGLNEGVTELLTTKFLNKEEPSAYDFQVYISDILIGLDKSLLNAYFSDEKDELLTFINNFSQRQNTITANDLIELPANSISFNAQLIVLQSAIQYDVSFAPNKEIMSVEYQRLNTILNSMKNNLNICETEDDYNQMKEILDKVVADKLLEIEMNQNIEESVPNKSMGFTKISLLIIVNLLISIAIVLLGIVLVE